MANREALRELQTRLATRLQAARNEGLSVSWLAVEAGGAHYLLSLAQSGEIFPWANIQPVPYTQPWFMGVPGCSTKCWLSCCSVTRMGLDCGSIGHSLHGTVLRRSIWIAKLAGVPPSTSW